MPQITQFLTFNGFEVRTNRLGLTVLVSEVKAIINGFDLNIAEEKNANGTAGIRQEIDEGFAAAGRWTKSVVGDVDWVASLKSGASLGVEVQVSERSDMIAVDILHLRKGFRKGVIDAGIIVVPDDELSKFLTDRTPSFGETQRHIEENYFDDQPIAVLSFRHDGVGPALKKQRTRQGRA